jgi:multidrug resistance efflux pump
LSASGVRTDGQASADRASLSLNGYTTLRSGHRQDQERTRRHITRPQRIAAVLLAVACVFGAAWYVPRIAASDAGSLSGSVTSNGIVYLNFSSSGQLATVTARLGQQVRKGQLLATEAAPAVAAVLSAARAAIAADKSELAAAQSAGSPAAIDAAQAQLARDQGQLAVDRADTAGTRIVAPAAGTVIAVNGQPGEIADAGGIRDYSSEAQGASITQPPLFSLFPDGPQSSVASDGSASAEALPVVALRTSSTWQVSVLVPENSVADVRTGEAVSIDVPAAGLTGVPGRVQELLATPVATSQGIDYEAVVNVLGGPQDSPPSGMAADVELRP